MLIRVDLCKKDDKPEKSGSSVLVIDEGQNGYDTGGKPKDERLDTGLKRNSLNVKFTLLKGKVSDINNILRNIDKYFNVVSLEIEAKNCEMSEQEYSRIMEGIEQLGVEVEEK